MSENKTTLQEHNERLAALVEQVEDLPDKHEPVLEPLTVSANGTYTPSEGVDGYSSVVVNVPEYKPVFETWVFTLEDGSIVEKDVEVSA